MKKELKSLFGIFKVGIIYQMINQSGIIQIQWLTGIFKQEPNVMGLLIIIHRLLINRLITMLKLLAQIFCSQNRIRRIKFIKGGKVYSSNRSPKEFRLNHLYQELNLISLSLKRTQKVFYNNSNLSHFLKDLKF